MDDSTYVAFAVFLSISVNVLDEFKACNGGSWVGDMDRDRVSLFNSS